MLFSSLIFLYYFLPIILIALFIAPSKWHNPLLLLASLIFYAWGNVSHLFILMASVVFNYSCGLWIDRTSSSWPIRFGIAINLTLLILFKYTNFFLENWNDILLNFGYTSIEWTLIPLPIGISFFTFQAISYLVDVKIGRTSVQKNPLDLGLYIALFPQLIAGPIVRYQDIAHQIKHRQRSWQQFSEGIERFIWGLAKKVLLANQFAVLSDEIFSIQPANLDPVTAWVGIICYTLQIYFDFSGYSDMAIGLGKMFGFNIPENFNFPYTASSIKDFWRRWHISLSTWFRDYLYIPLGGNRISPQRTYFNLIIVFFLTGLWHGANWTFIFWGLFHGSFLLFERIGGAKVLDRIGRPFAISYTLLVVMIAWVFFRSPNLSHALAYCQSMIGWNGNPSFQFDLMYYLDYEFLFFAGISLLACTPFLKQAWQWISDQKSMIIQWSTVLILITTFLYCTMHLVVNNYNPFIYFQF